MDKQAALRKGLKEKPEDTPAALAWLYNMFAILRGMFSKNLPELAAFKRAVQESEDQPKRAFTVLAWTTVGDDAEFQLRRLGAQMTPEERAIYVENLNSEDIKVLRHRSSVDPEDVDWMIADLALTYKGQGTITLSGPGVALRLNRKARRAAISRVRRTIRRQLRAEARDRRLAREALRG